jgi:hypothetical protein
MAFTSGEFRKALGVFPTGVAAVTARAPVGGAKGPNHSRRSQHPKARPWHRLHVGVQA